MVYLLSRWFQRSSGIIELLWSVSLLWGVQPMRGCGCANKVLVRADFGMRLISILVREYRVFYLAKVEIVRTRCERKKEWGGLGMNARAYWNWNARAFGLLWTLKPSRFGGSSTDDANVTWIIWVLHVLDDFFHVFKLFFILFFNIQYL